MASETAPVEGAAARGGVARDEPSRAARAQTWNDIDTWSLMTAKFLAGIGFWGGLGYLVDRWLGTGPWLFGVGTMLGLVASLYLMWLTTEPGRASTAARSERRRAQREGRRS